MPLLMYLGENLKQQRGGGVSPASHKELSAMRGTVDEKKVSVHEKEKEGRRKKKKKRREISSIRGGTK